MQGTSYTYKETTPEKFFFTGNKPYGKKAGEKNLYEKDNHLGNVRATVSDRKYADSTANILSYTHYYAFGSELVGKTFNTNSYGFGFNGMPKDDEVKGSGNSYDFGARIFDSRLGRWLSVDPKFDNYSGWTPYNFSFNNPVLLIDPDGESPNYPRLIATAFKKLDITEGYHIRVDEKTFDSYITITKVVIDKQTDTDVSFYVFKTKIHVNGNGEIEYVDETIKYYKASSDNWKGDNMVIKGVSVNRMEKAPTTEKAGQYFGNDAEKYVERYDKIVNEWSKMIKETPYLVKDGNAPFEKITKERVINAALDLFEGLGNPAPNTSNLFSRANTYRLYEIDKDEIKEAPAQIKAAKKTPAKKSFTKG